MTPFTNQMMNLVMAKTFLAAQDPKMIIGDARPSMRSSMSPPE